jgi:hypothetical protein
VFSSLGCTGRAHFLLLATASCALSVAMLASSGPPDAAFPPA